jgi:hypothetical protein
VALASSLGLSWRLPVVAVGIGSLLYAALIASTAMPHPANIPLVDGPNPGGPDRSDRLAAQLRANATQVLSDPGARPWLLFLLAFEVFEAALVLRYVWLHDHVGMSQGQVALYAVAEQVATLAGLALLDHSLARRDSGRVLMAACVGTLIAFPAWLATPGIAGRFLVGLPLTACTTVLWPIAKARSLVSIPGRAGAVSAVANLFAIIPLALGFGVLAQAIGLTAAMLVLGVPAACLLVLLSWRNWPAPWRRGPT